MKMSTSENYELFKTEQTAYFQLNSVLFCSLTSPLSDTGHFKFVLTECSKTKEFLAIRFTHYARICTDVSRREHFQTEANLRSLNSEQISNGKNREK